MKFLFYYSVLAIAVTHGATTIASATMHDEAAAGVTRTTGGGNLRSSGAATTTGNNNGNNLNVFQERQLSSDTCKPCEVHSDCRNTYWSYCNVYKQCEDSQTDEGNLPVYGIENGCKCGNSIESNDKCLSGRCDGLPGDETCRATLDNGETCNENSDCTSGRCDGPTNSQTCRETLEEDEYCNEDSDCTSGYCDPIHQICLMCTSCENDTECNVGYHCNAYQQCQKDNTATEIKLGCMCGNSDNNDLCASGRCDGPTGSATCREQKASGEGHTCNEHSDCESGRCDGLLERCNVISNCEDGPREQGVCKEKLRARESCDEDADCIHNRCSTDGDNLCCWENSCPYIYDRFLRSSS